MNYQELAKLFSMPRLERYLEASHGNEIKAAALYQQAQILASYYFAMIGCFEIVLRNKIDRHFTRHYQDKTDEWLIWMSSHDSPLDVDNTRDTYKHLRETMSKIKREIRDKGRGGALTNNKVVSGMSLGFWNTLFFKDEFTALDGSIIDIAPKIPTPQGRNSTFYLKKYKRTEFSNRLNLITTYRNKIAHHDQIVLASDNTFYLKPLELLEKYISELTVYMGETTDVYSPSLELISQQKTRLGNIIR